MAVYYAITTGGNFSSANTWASSTGQSVGGAGVPTSADTVNIDGTLLAGSTVIVDTSSAACGVLNCTGCVGTLNFGTGKKLTASGNVTWGSGMTISGTGTLAFGASLTYTSNGVPFSGDWSIGAFTLTLGDTTETLTGSLTTTGSATINSHTLNIGGNLTLGAAITGTATLVMNGTGTWSGNFSMNSNLTFNTSGTITISGTVASNISAGCTITYTAGTMVVTGSTLSLGNAIALNTGGMTWNIITFGTGSSRQITLSSALNADTFQYTGNGTLTFAGNFPITVNKFIATQNGTISFVAGQSLNCATQLTLGGIGSTLLVKSGTASSSFFINYTGTLANEELVEGVFTDIDASGSSSPLYNFKGGTLTRCKNIINFNAGSINVNTTFFRLNQ